jgi:hypothetical protein
VVEANDAGVMKARAKAGLRDQRRHETRLAAQLRADALDGDRPGHALALRLENDAAAARA